jgi:hypothetical protein
MAAQCLSFAQQTPDVQLRCCLLAIAQKWLDLDNEETDRRRNTSAALYRLIQTIIGQELRGKFGAPADLPHQMLALLMQLNNDNEHNGHQ